ncbi:hypothetical protein A2U01_0049021, partial [Trifolium medium]|nr:hypothetical protein [Trifolium medium]
MRPLFSPILRFVKLMEKGTVIELNGEGEVKFVLENAILT